MTDLMDLAVRNIQAKAWDADVEACKKVVNEDPNISDRTPQLARIAAFAKCMEGMGWEAKGKNR